MHSGTGRWSSEETRPERQGATTFYWAVEGDDTHEVPETEPGGNGDVVGGNLENNEIVVTMVADKVDADPDGNRR